ncbi:phosphotransferase [Embleya scabrispora]|uniref:phosphotransferase n=1 Tax=Embleya scabrispora TaxID=159449 RepID=UPI001F2A37F8|nr:phosphotransferase [Embleya scabrispora]
MERIAWDALSVRTRTAVHALTGRIHSARPVEGGHHSALAVHLDTTDGPVFVKGIRADHPLASAQRREARIGESLAGVGPRVLWQLLVDGWDLVGFEFVHGRHAQYHEHSRDLNLLADTLTVLANLPLPAAEVPSAATRWAVRPEDTDLRAALQGHTLCHADFNPENILVTPDRLVLVDWGWAVRGPAWLDPALVVIRLIATGGQTPPTAQSWAMRMPAWRGVPDRVITDFAKAEARLWDDIAERRPEPWSRALADAAHAWVAHRMS